MLVDNLQSQQITVKMQQDSASFEVREIYGNPSQVNCLQSSVSYPWPSLIQHVGVVHSLYMIAHLLDPTNKKKRCIKVGVKQRLRPECFGAGPIQAQWRFISEFREKFIR